MKCRIKNELSSAQKKILHQECVKTFDKQLAIYNKQVALQVLHILRFEFGFGQQRLKRFSDKLEEMQIKTIGRYECTDGEVPDILEIKLRESGINVDELLKDD